MSGEDNKEFFECLGEIWRDITAIEFLMRTAITKHDGEESIFPIPPYTKDKIYNQYPDSFGNYNFEIIVEKFNKRFPSVNIPKEVIALRNAMAHGVIAQINNSGVDELIKFRENKAEKKLIVEFSLPLTIDILRQLRQSLKEFRGYIMKELK